MKIGIFLSGYPVFSETFVHNELFYLQKNKIEGKIWYELEPERISFHPVVDEILFSKTKIPHKIFCKIFFLQIVKAHLHFLIKYPLRYLSLWYKPIFLKWWDLRSIIKAPLIALEVNNFKADLLYVHEADRAYYFAFLSSILCKIPIGIIFHTYFLFSKSKYVAQKIISADFVVCQSRYSKNYIQNNFSIDSKYFKKIKVVSSPGVDVNFFKKIKTKRDNVNCINLITVCRLEKSKGCHLLIKSIALLKQKNVKVKCKIIGYGSQRNNLIALCKKLKVDKDVSFLGAIPHNKKLIKHLSSSDIFVLPSIIDEKNDRDMQPNVIKEAMSTELLVITSNLGGIKELIKDKNTGFLLDKVSVENLVKIITEVHGLEKAKKEKIIEAARIKIEKFYEINNTIKKLINLFENNVNK